FIFGFLPIVAAGFVLIGHAFGRSAALAVLLLASLVFYGAWGLGFLPVLLGSAVFNFLAAAAIPRRRRPSRPATAAAALAIGANLALLGYFKYTNFFIENVNALFLPAGSGIAALSIVLPLGISFFTFQQIAFLVDTLNGREQEPSLREYLLFVTFFPSVTSGPILNQN